MRTTLTIHDPLLKKAKEVSLQRDVTIGELVEEGLRLTLGAKPKKGRGAIRPLKTYRGDGIQPGVDLTNSSALLEAMEGR
jgi:hypothetical protein